MEALEAQLQVLNNDKEQLQLEVHELKQQARQLEEERNALQYIKENGKQARRD